MVKLTNGGNKDKILAMKVLELTDLFKNTAVQIELPKDIEFHTYQLVLLNTGKEKVVGKVITYSLDKKNPYLDEDYSFERVLTDEEIAAWKEKENVSFKRVIRARELAEENKLDIHFFQSRDDFEEKHVSFFFTSKVKVDFRELLKDLAKEFKKRIYLQRVSANDRLKMVGVYDISGRDNVNDFAKFFKDRPTMNVVRDQGIMIRNNQRIFDMSGKLKGSLVYEVEHYREMRRHLPHIKQKVIVDGRPGQVTGLDILNQKVKIAFDDGGFAEPFPIEKVQIPGKIKQEVNKEAPVEKPAVSDRIKKDIERAAQAAKNK